MTGMCFHWRELHARKREEKKKKKEEETSRQRCVQKERSLGPKRKTNVIVHWLSLRQPSLTNWLSVSLPISPPPLSLSLPASLSLCLLRWTVTQFWMSPSRPPICTHGCRLCHRLGVRRGLQRAGRWSLSPGSLWLRGEEGRRKSRGDKHWEEQNKKWREDAKGMRRASGINRGRTNKGGEGVGVNAEREREKRKTKNKQERDGGEKKKKKSDHPFWKLERGLL